MNLAILVGTQGDVATLVQRLGAYRGHHVCSGAGQVAYFGPVELWTGRGLAFVARFDEAVEDLQTAVEVCSANGAVGYLAEAQYEARPRWYVGADPATSGGPGLCSPPVRGRPRYSE